PRVLAALEQKRLELRRREWSVGEYRDHSWRAVAMLAEMRVAADGRDRFPRGALSGSARVCLQGARDSVGYAIALRLHQPVPSLQQQHHVACIAMDGTKVSRMLAIEVLGPDRTMLGFRQVRQQANSLRLEDGAPAVLSGQLGHEDRGQHGAG